LAGQLKRIRQLAQEQAAAQSASKRQARKRAEPSADRAATLRQQIKALQSELGEVDPVEREVIDLLRFIETSDLPARVAGQARAEVERLRTVGAAGPEASDIRAYVDWLIHMPWRKTATRGPATIDLA